MRSKTFFFYTADASINITPFSEEIFSEEILAKIENEIPALLVWVHPNEADLKSPYIPKRLVSITGLSLKRTALLGSRGWRLRPEPGHVLITQNQENSCAY